ncbi:MAG: hypothetical protein ACFB2X_06070 [Rivularia sp. (in: cyanobacteria)]
MRSKMIALFLLLGLAVGITACPDSKSSNEEPVPEKTTEPKGDAQR